MPLKPTRFSRVSIGWRNSTQSLVDLDAADTGPAFSVTGGAVYGGGTQLNYMWNAAIATDFGSVAGHDSSTKTITAALAEAGDVLTVTLPSTWSGAYYDLNITAQCLTDGVITAIASNSAATAIDPDSAAIIYTGLRF